MDVVVSWFSQQSVAMLDEALAYAHALRHPHTEGYVLFFGAQLSFDLDATRPAPGNSSRPWNDSPPDTPSCFGKTGERS